MSNRSEKEKMKDRIRKRAERFRKMRNESVKTRTYTQIIFEFLKDMDLVYTTATDDEDYKDKLDNACRHLVSKMRVYDHDVQLTIEWNDGDSFSTLRVAGVTITWSPEYIAKNPNTRSPEYVDITQFFLEDLDV